MRNVLILGGDDISYEGVLSQIGEEDLIICADHGADHARAMKLNPNIIVGDMDSVHPDTLAWAHSKVSGRKGYDGFRNCSGCFRFGLSDYGRPILVRSD